MKKELILQELEALAQRLSIKVRYEDFEGKGGLCRYGGGTYLILNKSLPIEERIGVFVREFAKVPLEDVFILPKIREMIDEGRKVL